MPFHSSPYTFTIVEGVCLILMIVSATDNNRNAVYMRTCQYNIQVSAVYVGLDLRMAFTSVVMEVST